MRKLTSQILFLLVFSISNRALAELPFSYSLQGGLSYFSVTSENSSSPSLVALSFIGEPEWAWEFLRFGPALQFDQIFQTSSATDESQDRNGYMYSIPFLIGFVFDEFALRLRFQLFGEYVLAEEDDLGNKISFQDLSGYNLSFRYYLSQDRFLNISYDARQFKKQKTGSTSQDIESDPLRVDSFGILYGFQF